MQLLSGTGILRRPVQLLYPLEVHSECGSSTANNSADGAERMRWQQTDSRARTRVTKSAQHLLRTRPVIQALSPVHKEQLHSKLEIACWLWLTLITVDPSQLTGGTWI